MPAPEDWIERAQYDRDTAEAMLKAGRYLYVLFCCQQAVEKALKAIIAKTLGEMPPRIHDLNRLAVKAGLKLTARRAQFFDRLLRYYVRSRYPEDIRRMSTALTRVSAERTFRQTEELLEWLYSLMT